jgi:enamine deaminase RidA (YjgF/YER057c/UK114 family)
MVQEQLKRELLVEDERGRGFPAVIKYGPYLFVSGSNGHRDPKTEKIDPEIIWKPSEQCSNSYARVAQRLEKAGYGGNCAVWIQNWTSGQEWRIPRMALWPTYFGDEEHALAVSFGTAMKMHGINMITTVVMAVTPEITRTCLVPQPHKGRASRITTGGDFIWVIGVGGTENPFTHELAPKETDDSYAIQLENSFDVLKSHLDKAGARIEDFVRLDACNRNINRKGQYFDYVKQRLGGKVPFAAYCIGDVVAKPTEQEIGGMAVNVGVSKEVAYHQERPDVAQAVRAAGLVFASGCSGLEDAKTGKLMPELHGDKAGQTRQALRRLEAALNRFDIGLDRVLRLDVFLDDPYFEDEFYKIANEVLGPEPPTMTVVGAMLENSAQVEVSAIAAA